MIPRSVGIVGLGLMGGSLARDLAERGIRVLGHDAREDVLDAAIAAGAVRDRLTIPPLPSDAVDLLVIATPVDTSVGLLRTLAPALPNALITDLGSTKGPICREAEGLGLQDRFVGSHPLVGDHRSGWEAARAGLYRGATVFLCPAAGPGSGGMTEMEDFWRDLGARPVPIDPGEHDRMMARVSHLPQVVASALAVSLARTGVRPSDLGPGGRDMTRLAASSPEMWRAITQANAAELDRALADVQQQLTSFRSFLAAGDTEALLDFFRTAQHWLD